jgi:hypothetical protein
MEKAKNTQRILLKKFLGRPRKGWEETIQFELLTLKLEYQSTGPQYMSSCTKKKLHPKPHTCVVQNPTLLIEVTAAVTTAVPHDICTPTGSRQTVGYRTQTK